MKKVILLVVTFSILSLNMVFANGGSRGGSPAKGKANFSGYTLQQLIQEEEAYNERISRGLAPAVGFLSSYFRVDLSGPGGVETFKRLFPRFCFASDTAARRKIGRPIWDMVKGDDGGFNPAKPFQIVRDLARDLWEMWMTIDEAAERQFMVDYAGLCGMLNGHDCSVDELEAFAELMSDALNEQTGQNLDVCRVVVVPMPVPALGRSNIPVPVFFPPGCGQDNYEEFMKLLNSIERNLEIKVRLEREQRIRDANGRRETNSGEGQRHTPMNDGGGLNGYIIGQPGPGESPGGVRHTYRCYHRYTEQVPDGHGGYTTITYDVEFPCAPG